MLGARGQQLGGRLAARVDFPAQAVGARGQQVGGRLAARVDFPAQAVGARDQQLGGRLAARVDLLGQALGARGEQVDGGLAARLDLLGHALGAPAQKIFETADARIQIVGDLHRLDAQRAVDVVDLGADAVGELGAARVDDAADVGDALVERAHHFVTALGDLPGDVRDAGGERLAERLGPPVEGVAETIEVLVEARRDLGRLDRDAGVEIVQVVAHRARNVLRALAETLDHLAAVGLHGAVELGKMAGDEIAERAGVACDPFGELGAAVVEHVLERLQPRREQVAHRVAAVGDDVGEFAAALVEHVLERLQPNREQFAHHIVATVNHVGELAAALMEHVLERLQPGREQVAHRLAAAGDHVGKRLGALVELTGQPVAVLHEGIGDARAGLLEFGDHVSAAQAQIEDKGIAGGLERGVDLLDPAGNGLGELVAGIDHEVGQLLRATAHQIENFGGLLPEIPRHFFEPLGHRALDIGGDLGELVADVIGLEVERRAQAVAGGRDRLRGIAAGAFEAGEQIAAALAERLDHRVAGVAQRTRDVLGPFGKGVSDPPRSVVDLLGNELADLGNVVAEIEVDAVDGVADLSGLADEGIALAAQILQQRADAHFVVVVGMFEGGNLVRHQRLEFGGARERALDAIAHGGHLAPDRLPDGDDRFARDRLGLGEPHGDLGHRLGDQPQFLRAPRHVGEHVEEDDRHEEDDGEHGQDRRREAGRPERGLQFGQIHPAEHEAGQHPQAGEDGRGDVGRVPRATLQGPQDLADGFTIVVGRAAQQARLLGCAQFLLRRAELLNGRLGSHGAPRRLRDRLLGRRRLRGGWTGGFRFHRGIACRERLLDRRKRRFRRVLDLLRSVCHVRRRLVLRWTRAAAGTEPHRATSAS